MIPSPTAFLQRELVWILSQKSLYCVTLSDLGAGTGKMLQDKYETSFHVTWIRDSWIHEFNGIHVFFQQNLQEDSILK